MKERQGYAGIANSRVELPRYRLGQRVLILEHEFTGSEPDNINSVWTGTVKGVGREISGRYKSIGTVKIFYEIAYDPGQNNGLVPRKFVFQSGLRTASIKRLCDRVRDN